MKVTLMSHTPNPEKLIAGAARLCYSADAIDNLFENMSDPGAFVDRLMDMHHESPIEHCTFTFGIEGVSRALLAQITRHRIASFSVKSQRYVNETELEYITPPQITADPRAHEIYLETMEILRYKYTKLADILKENLINSGVAPAIAEKSAIEDARFVLPNACETKMIMTMNARSLLNFFRLRCCERAQWEIRALADEMLQLVTEVAPTLFKKAGAPCVSGRCPEGEKSCGRVKRK